MPDARFVILGEGELREHLERQVHEHHLEKHVLLPGFRTDVLGCIKGFDLFVMSSVTEGLGTSLLDAMACSRPIVATRAGGIPEVVEDGVTGLLVPPRDHARDGRARSCALLQDDGAAPADGRRRASRACSERFTVERMVAETAAVYARVAGRPHAAGTERPPAARLKPHAFIIPRWQSEKSYLTGSSGSSRRSDAVMSRAIRQPGLV